MYSVQNESNYEVPAQWPPELAGQKRPVVTVVHDVSDDDDEEPPRVRPRLSDNSGSAGFGDSLGRLLSGQAETEGKASEARSPAALGTCMLSSQGTDCQSTRIGVCNQGIAGKTAATALEDTGLMAQVARIQRVAGNDFRAILGLGPLGQSLELQTVQSNYRQLMRLLHPDKRNQAAESAAGGKEVCDDAMERVQKALLSAKKEIEAGGPDATVIAMDSMRRMQEIQRQRARQAMKRQEDKDLGSMMADIDAVLSQGETSFIPRHPSYGVSQASAQEQDLTAQQIADLLNQIG